MTAAELDALAARMTLADFVGLGRRVVLAAYPEITSAAIVGQAREDGDPLTLPLVKSADRD